MALTLYQQLKPGSDAYEKYLYWSGLLHEVGLAVSLCARAEQPRLEAIELYTGSALIPVERARPAAGGLVVGVRPFTRQSTPLGQESRWSRWVSVG